MIDALQNLLFSNETPDIVLFLGRFHPLVLHFPIALLLFSAGLELFRLKKKKNTEDTGQFSISPDAYAKVARITWIWGTISAAIALLFGLLLGLGGGYNEDLLNSHAYWGIGLFFAALLCAYFHENKKIPHAVTYFSILLTLIALIVTAHHGGSLSHGKDYLFTYAPDGLRKLNGLPPKKVAQKNALYSDKTEVYKEIIVPILRENCFECHGPEKQKNGCRLDSIREMESYGVVIPGDLESSMLYTLLVTDDDEDIMPPVGKGHITPKKVELIKLWILSGASYTETLGESSHKEAFMKELKK